MGVNVFFEQDFGIGITIEFDQDITGAGIFGIVISKLSY